MIVNVDEGNIEAAARIHSAAWKKSHRHFCTPEFVERHSPEAQKEYLLREMRQGKQIFMLAEDEPAGIVSVQGNAIENLYVLPELQNRGYGSRLLEYAISQCEGEPCLWVLSNNAGARRLYLRHGFRESGRQKRLRDDLYEMELHLVRHGK